jgi:hypothetical protein
MKINALALKKVLPWVTVFGIAMAYLESAVVVYLRALYYPAGFGFPMQPVDFVVGITELGRELATLIMLIAIAVIMGKNPLQRFGYFLYTFAIWDIFYYVFLWILIQWPTSLFEWDILFLIPVVWVSPVICPLITSISMITLALFLIIGVEKNEDNLINWYVWVLLVFGSCLVLLSFTIDYLKFISESADLKNSIITYEGNRKLLTSANYIPGPFNWFLFIMGELLIIGAIVNVGTKYFKVKVAK